MMESHGSYANGIMQSGRYAVYSGIYVMSDLTLFGPGERVYVFFHVTVVCPRRYA